MQQQFQKEPLLCLEQKKEEVLTREQNQELRLPEDMPAIGQVLGAWGQVLIRSKEWNSGSMVLSCGVMAWVLYRPEEGGEPQTVEGWLPFRFQWELPDTEADGIMNVTCLLRSVDARPVAARRLMVRASVEALGEAWVQMEAAACVSGELPEDVCLLKRNYPVMLPVEAGEKAFSIEEELALPSSAPKPEKILRFSLHPELTERKVMAGKVVFRGAALIHILYQTEEKMLCAWDLSVPFSQFSDLERDCGEGAAARIDMAVTALELDLTAEGRLRLTAGLTGQYLIFDRVTLTLAEDAYSPYRSVVFQKEDLYLPQILECSERTVTAELAVPENICKVVDVAFYPEQPRLIPSPADTGLQLAGQFQILGRDPEGALKGSIVKWNSALAFPVAENAAVTCHLTASGVPQPAGGADIHLHLMTKNGEGMAMITELALGEEEDPDPGRPSLILRKAGQDSLWEIAKASLSTVERICRANNLKEDPSPEQMLIVPIV